MAAKQLVIQCPRCKRPCNYNEKNEFRPFCSQRCKVSDIAAWATDSYAVPGEPINPEEIVQVGEENGDEILPN